jgi:hypothetical protein
MEEGPGMVVWLPSGRKGSARLRRHLTPSPHRRSHTTTQPSSIEEEGFGEASPSPADGLSPAPRRAKLAHHIGEILS